MPAKKNKTTPKTPPAAIAQNNETTFDEQLETLRRKVRVTVFNNTTSHDELEVPQFTAHIAKVNEFSGKHYLTLDTGHTFVTELNNLAFDFEGDEIVLEPGLEIIKSEETEHFLIEADPVYTPVGGYWRVGSLEESNPKTLVCHPWKEEDDKELLRLRHAAALKEYIRELKAIIDTAIPAIDIVNMAHMCTQLRELLVDVRDAAREMEV